MQENTRFFFQNYIYQNIEECTLNIWKSTFNTVCDFYIFEGIIDRGLIDLNEKKTTFDVWKLYI